MARGFHAMWFPGTQELWELYLLPDIANRHICPEAKGNLWLQACKPHRQRICLCGLRQSKNRHGLTSLRMLSCPHLLQSIQTTHHQQLHRGETTPGCFRGGQTQPVTWGSQGHRQKVCPQWHTDFPFFHNEPFSLLNTALSPNCLQLFYCPQSVCPASWRTLEHIAILHTPNHTFSKEGVFDPPKYTYFFKSEWDLETFSKGKCLWFPWTISRLFKPPDKEWFLT